MDELSKLIPRREEETCRLLDIGCGDGFLLEGVACRFPGVELIGVDTALSAHQADDLTARFPKGRCRFFSTLDTAISQADIILLMDVLEHVDDDRRFLTDMVKWLRPGGRIVLTVPAFPSLFGPHDDWLGHHRRYRLARLRELGTGTRLTVDACGYFFLLPLVARIVERLCSRFAFWRRKPQGVTAWKRGMFLTTLISSLLTLDARLLLMLGKVGIRFPGLSCMAIYAKSRS